MLPKLTHEDACRLVEDAIEKCHKTLAYIRLKLEYRNPNPKREQLSLFEQTTVEHANLLCNINWYGAYIAGAKAMYRALTTKGFIDYVAKKEDRIAYDAMLKAYMQSTRNMEWLLTDVPKGVELITTFERDKKGKIVKATSRFVKKETKYKEI